MNTKKVRINIPDEQILKRIATTPALKRLSRLVLKVGDNIETVNHKQFADMVRLYSLINVTVTDIKI